MPGCGRKILGTIEATGKEGRDDYLQLLHQLESAARMPSAERSRREAPAADSLPAEHEKTSAAAESAIRVDVGLLDKLMNLVGNWCWLATRCYSSPPNRKTPP